MSSDRELKIIIKADGSIAAQEIDRLKQSVGKLGDDSVKSSAKTEKLSRAILGTSKAAADSSKEVKKATTTWADFATGLNQAWEIAEKGKRILGTGWEWAKQGAQLQEARASFEDYSRSIGRSSSEILSKLKQASGGTIDDMNLIITASKAMSLGVTQDADKMGNLLLVARNKARLFGMDTTQAFNDIVIGIGRQSPLILDNLGIRIPAGFEKMTEKMTETEKTAKLLELTLIEGNKQLSDMGGVSETAADKIRQFEAAISNLKAEFGSLTSEAFTPFVSELRNNIIPAIRDVVREYVDAVRQMGGQDFAAQRIFDSQGRAGQLGKKKAQIDDAAKRERQALQDLNKTYGSLSSYDQQRFGLNYAGNKNASIDEIRSKIGVVVTYAREEAALLDKELEKLKAKLSAETLPENIFLGLEKDFKEAEEFSNSLFESLSQDLNKELSRTGDSGKKASSGIKDLKVSFDALATSGAKSFEGIDDYFENFTDGLDRLVDDFEDAADDIGKIREEIDKSLAELSLERYKQLKNLDANTAQWGLMNFMSSGLLNAGTDGDPLVKFQRDDKVELERTIAEAVSAGFANADFSNFSLTLGSILSDVLSRSVAQSNPILDTAGNINWGNVGTNLAVSFATKAITGLFTTKEKNKEVIQQASGIEKSISDAYLKTFESELLPFISGSAGGNFFKQQLANARKGVNGLNIGYTYDKGWSWGDMSWVKDYQLNAPGAGDVQANLDYWNKAAEKFNTEQARNVELMEASGLTFDSLVKKADAYTNAAKAAGLVLDTRTLQWTGYGDRAGQNPLYETDLSDEIHDLRMASAELVRQLGQATADRVNFASEGFTRYAPWLSTMQMPEAVMSSGLRINIKDARLPYDPRPKSYFPISAMDSLSSTQQYDAFSKLQTDFLDRNISTFLIDMVKQAGQSMFDLESLQVTDIDAYKAEYLDYLDKQMSAFEEVMRRQEEIFYNESKTYEERASALENYERNMQSYHQAKLDKLRLEKQQEEEEKRMMAEQRQAKMESALSLIGEVSQRGDRVVILQGGDTAAAIKELMAEFKDNPEVTAVLQSSLAKTEAKARWGN